MKRPLFPIALSLSLVTVPTFAQREPWRPTPPAKLFTCMVLLLLLFASETVLADNFICGTKIIQSGLRVGLTEFEVTRDCGDPVAVKGNRWTYVRPDKRIIILVFDEAGQLTAIFKR